MSTISTTISNGIEFGIAYPSPLTITTTGYVDAGNNGYHGAAVYGAAGNSLYLNNQGRIAITQIGASGVEDATNSGFSLNNSGTSAPTGTDSILRTKVRSPTAARSPPAQTTASATENDGLQITNTSSGVINGYSSGLNVHGITVSNSGTITATSVFGYGVELQGGPSTISNAGAIVSKVGIAVSGTANQTIIDSGTISGTGTSHTAISFNSGNDLLQFTPSTSIKIQGTVNGGGGTNTLEFASAKAKRR